MLESFVLKELIHCIFVESRIRLLCKKYEHTQMYKEYQSLLLKNTRIHDINCQYKGSYMWWVGDLGFNPNLPILDGKSDYELSRGFKIERI